jgi:hypothetical protein
MPLEADMPGCIAAATVLLFTAKAAASDMDARQWQLFIGSRAEAALRITERLPGRRESAGETSTAPLGATGPLNGPS